MTKTYFISDMHFGHYNAACVFTKADGTPMRGFKSVEEQDYIMLDNWNNTVNPEDRVYVLGDIAMKRKDFKNVVPRLNGRLCVILGNHDPWGLDDWKDFQNVTHLGGAKLIPALGWVLTHIPVHERQLQGRWTHNIHGHLHANHVTDKFGKRDKRYFNVSVEQINYTPIEIEELKERLND